MAITFVCTCGKHLRAADDHAGRRIMCPACGSPVGVPSGEDPRPQSIPFSSSPVERHAPPENSADNPGPVLFRLRRRRGDPNRSAEAVWVPLEGNLLPGPEAKIRKRRRRARQQILWRLENNWLECLFYPVRAMPLVVGLGAGLGVFAAIVVGVYPRFAELLASPAGAGVFTGMLLGIVVIGYTVGFLDCVLASAIAGEHQQIRWPGTDGYLLMRSCLTWLLCFLAGPAFFAGAAALFWFFGGDLDRVDQAILGELSVMALGYWLLALMAAAESGRLIAGPDAVAAVFWRLGWPSWLVVLAAFGSALLLGPFAVVALEEFHRAAVSGLFLLICTGVTVMYLSTFMLRYLGVLHYRRRAL